MEDSLKGPCCPLAGLHIIEWFNKLNNLREWDGMSGQPKPINPSCVESWCRLSGVKINPSEYGIISDLDVLYRNTMSSEESDLKLGEEISVVLEHVKSAKMSLKSIA